MDLDQLTTDLFRHTAAADIDAVAAMCAPDCRVKQNIGDEGGAEMLLGIVQATIDLGLTVTYSDIRRIVAEGAVTEQHLVTITKADGTRVSSDVCVVLRFDDHGLVTRIDEYVDPTSLMAAFT